MSGRRELSVARTVALEDGFDPLAHAPEDAIVWAQGERALVAWGELARIDPGVGDGRFARASEQVTSILGSLRVDDRVASWATGPLAFGAFSFDPDSGSSLVTVPSVILGRDSDRAWLTTIDDEAPVLERSQGVESRTRHVRRMSSSVADAAWITAVASAASSVRDGLVDKVVLARDVFVGSDRPFEERSIVARLRRDYPECFTFAFDGMLGATPELLVRRRGERVGSVVLAGSAPRGSTPSEDDELARGLLASTKDRREHELAVQSVRDALNTLCEDVEADPRPSVLALSYVQHLCTRVGARQSRAWSALDLVGALHPTAAVCGVPTDKALVEIRELERLERGRYCGPVGWMDRHGDGEWAIALRCAEVSGSQARLFAGAGIMGDSDPIAELGETELKLRPLLDALGAPIAS